jgi:hypothetical protein
MIPQLWTRHFDFPEWRLQHPNIVETLGIEEAIRFYEAELQLFNNYQEEIVNQMRNRQNNLAKNILNVSNTISEILKPAVAQSSDPFRYTADYLGFKGQKAVSPNTGEGRFIGSGTVFEVDDLFSYEITIQGGGGNISQNGIYKVVSQYTLPSSPTPGIAITRFTTGLAAGFFEKIALLDGTPI